VPIVAAPNASRLRDDVGRGAWDIRARRLGLHGGVLLGRFRRALSVLALMAIDVCGLALALYAALATARLARGDPLSPGIIWLAEGSWLPFIALIVCLVFASNGLYRAREVRPTGAKVFSSLALATVIVLLFAIAVHHQARTYSLFWVTFVYSAVLIATLRASYDSITLTLMRLLGIRRRTLLAGPARALPDLNQALRQSAGRGPDVELIGVATEDGADAMEDAITLGSVGQLSELVALYEPDDLVIGGLQLPETQLLELVERCREHRTRLRLVPTTTQLLLERAVFVPGQALPLLEVRPPLLIGIDWAVKRAFDLIVSALLLLLLSPLLLLIALAVKLSSPGPVIYRDRRVGVGEREFDMLKFRSMYRDAAEHQAELEPLNEASGAIFKIREDPRVTPVGRVLRRLSLDELPQLVNVLRREMSLVGPRPLPLRDYELLEPWHRKRYLVLPGITGLWQTSRRANLSFDDLVRLDFYYFENWSIWLDIAILVRTPLAVARGEGAY
jgi:exopolysaccharide biosynthesis polyprenyl glycosylphosphotransferase